jgi:hypothetical protein
MGDGDDGRLSRRAARLGPRGLGPDTEGAGRRAHRGGHGVRRGQRVPVPGRRRDRARAAAGQSGRAGDGSGRDRLVRRGHPPLPQPGRVRDRPDVRQLLRCAAGPADAAVPLRALRLQARPSAHDRRLPHLPRALADRRAVRPGVVSAQRSAGRARSAGVPPAVPGHADPRQRYRRRRDRGADHPLDHGEAAHAARSGAGVRHRPGRRGRARSRWTSTRSRF